MTMGQNGYLFALAFLGLAAYNALRAWWGLRGQGASLMAAWHALKTPAGPAARKVLGQHLGKKEVSDWDVAVNRFYNVIDHVGQKAVMGGISILFCVLSLGAAAVIGGMTWHAERNKPPAAQAESSAADPDSSFNRP